MTQCTMKAQSSTVSQSISGPTPCLSSIYLWPVKNDISSWRASISICILLEEQRFRAEDISALSRQNQLTMHYLPFMAAITLPPWWRKEMEEGAWRRRGVVVVKGKHSQQKVGGESCGALVGCGVWGGGGGSFQTIEALSTVLCCTLSMIATQIRASHHNHLHTVLCSEMRDDQPVVAADIFI